MRKRIFVYILMLVCGICSLGKLWANPNGDSNAPAHWQNYEEWQYNRILRREDLQAVISSDELKEIADTGQGEIAEEIRKAKIAGMDNLFETFQAIVNSDSPFEILGIDNKLDKLDAEVVKKNYDSLMKIFHPNSNNDLVKILGEGFSHQIIVKIILAKEVLSKRSNFELEELSLRGLDTEGKRSQNELTALFEYEKKRNELAQKFKPATFEPTGDSSRTDLSSRARTHATQTTTPPRKNKLSVSSQPSGLASSVDQQEIRSLLEFEYSLRLQENPDKAEVAFLQVLEDTSAWRKKSENGFKAYRSFVHDYMGSFLNSLSKATLADRLELEKRFSIILYALINDSDSTDPIRIKLDQHRMRSGLSSAPVGQYGPGSFSRSATRNRVPSATPVEDFIPGLGGVSASSCPTEAFARIGRQKHE